MRSLFRTSAVLAALSLPLAGHALDLVGSYEKARHFDPAMRAADEAVLAGREKAVQGRSLLLPQVSLTASQAQVRTESSASLPAPVADLFATDSAGRATQVAVQLRQPVYDAQAVAGRRQLELATELAENAWRDAGRDLVQRVSETYFNVLLAQESLRVTGAERAAVGLQRDRAKARFEVGRGKITEVQEAQARYDAVVTRELSARSTLELREAQFEEVTGAKAAGLAGLREGFAPVPPQPQSLGAWQQRGLAGNTRVAARRSELAIATAEIDKYRLAGRPRLDLVAGYTWQGQSGSLSPVVAPDGNRTGSIGLQLSVPLYAGGALDSKARESIARRNQAEQDLGAAQRDTRLQVQDAFLAVTTGISRIAALEQSVLSARTALEATTLGRDVGSRTELDVLDSQQRFYAAQLDLAQARHDYLLGRVRLSAAAGDLGEDDLRDLNAFLDR